MQTAPELKPGKVVLWDRRSRQHTKQLGLSQVWKSCCGLRENFMGKEQLRADSVGGEGMSLGWGRGHS